MIHILEETNIIFIRFQPHVPDDFIETANSMILELIQKYNSFTIHLDLKGLNITTLVKNISWIESVFKGVDQTNYNQYLQEVLIFNAPFISKQIYSIMSRFMKDMKHKVRFVPKVKEEASAQSKGSAMEGLKNSIGFSKK
jgi:hypothetical protein